MRVYNRLFGGLIAAAVVLSSLAVAQSPQSIKNLPNISIENFGCVNQKYYRGARPSKSQLGDLATFGVKSIVNLEREGMADEQEITESLGMKFFRIGMSTKSKPNLDQVDQFLRIVNDPQNQPVFVHCKGGRHRTGVMTAVYRLAHDGWNPDQAYAEMKLFQFEKGFASHGALRDFVYERFVTIGAARARQATTQAATTSPE